MSEARSGGELITRLRDVVGDPGLVTDPDQSRGYLTDWRDAYRGRTAAVVRPGSTEEVAAVVGLCREAGVALVPRAGTRGCAGERFPTTPVARWCCR